MAASATSFLPGAARLARYERAWLRGDVLAGLTVAAYLVPQVMAYAEMAGVPPVAGLWTVIGAMTVYALLGSSPQLSVGPESTTSLMTAVALAPIAAGDPERYASLAAMLALVVAGICVVARIARLGFLADLLSKPVLVGYMAGVAVIMITGQLDTAARMEIDSDRPLAAAWHLLSHLGDAHRPTLITTVVVVVFLVVAGRYFPRLPHPLIAIVMAAIVVKVFDLRTDGLEVIGAVPTGLPSPRLPDVSRTDLVDLLLPAVGVTVVAYTDNTLTGRSFASRRGDKVDANQELVALAGANVAAGVLRGMPVSSSGSRTVIGDSLGSRSQLYSLVAVVMVVLTLLFLGPLLELFPRAALAALVIWAAIKLVDLAELRRIGRFRKSELVLALLTTVAVLVFDIVYGVLVAIGLSVLDLIRRVARPHDGVLGYVPGKAGMHDIDDYSDARQVPGLMVYRYDSPLFFANAENFHERALASLEVAEGPVEWVLLNFEANVHIDLTSVDALTRLHDELAARGITLALARVKHEMYGELERSGLIDEVGRDHVFATLPTAVVAYFAAYERKHGRPPAGVLPPDPPAQPSFGGTPGGTTGGG
jgi:SulP family sulfate permease